jgi:hypothetical protein
VDDVSPANLNGSFKGEIASKGNLWYGGAYANLTNGFIDLYGTAFLSAISRFWYTASAIVLPVT